MKFRLTFSIFFRLFDPAASGATKTFVGKKEVATQQEECLFLKQKTQTSKQNVAPMGEKAT